ncbi:MAG: hypothetical protein RR988_02060 [Clostridia bacterium]
MDIAKIILLLGIVILCIIIILFKNLKRKSIQRDIAQKLLEKHIYYKDEKIIKQLKRKNDFITKNNKIEFLANYLRITETNSNSRPTLIDINNVIEIRKEYIGEVCPYFNNEKIWDGYGITIKYTNENRILQKTILLKEKSDSVYGIVDNVRINLITNLIINKLELIRGN